MKQPTSDSLPDIGQSLEKETSEVLFWEKSQVSAVQKQMFYRLIEYLDNNSFRYCVVGNTESFPDDIESDIDIVVSDEDLKTVISGLFEFQENDPLQLVQLIQHEKTAFYTAIAYKSDRLNPVFIHPDICSHYYRYGRLLLRAESLLEYRQLNDKGFYIPSPAAGFIYYLLKRIDKQSLNQEQSEHLSFQYHQDPTGSENLVRIFWDKDDADKIVEAANQNQWQAVMTDLRQLQAALYKKCRLSLQDRLDDGFRKLRRLSVPTGVMVAFLGPDGCGKSTVIEDLQKRLNTTFRRIETFHLRPGFLGKSKGADLVIDEPHKHPPRGAVLSLAKLIYLVFDYILGYWILIYPELFRSGLVLFDRYLADLWVDPKRFRHSAPQWISWLVSQIVPQPHIYFLLDAPAETLQQRKQEVSFEETLRQREAYLSWKGKKKHVCLIDVSQPLDRVYSDVYDALLSYMACKVRKNYAPE